MTRRSSSGRQPGAHLAVPAHRSRQPRHAAERKTRRTGSIESTMAARTGSPEESTPSMSCGRRGGVVPVCRDGPEPAQDLSRRRVVHGVRDDDGARLARAPGLAGIGSRPRCRPWPHQRTHHLVDVAREHGRLFHPELAADRVVVKGLGRLRRRDVEAGEVAAGVAPVSRFGHLHHGSRPSTVPSVGAWAGPERGGVGRRPLGLNAAEELGFLGRELLLRNDSPLAQIVQLNEPVPNFGRAPRSIGGAGAGAGAGGEPAAAWDVRGGLSSSSAATAGTPNGGESGRHIQGAAFEGDEWAVLGVASMRRSSSGIGSAAPPPTSSLICPLITRWTMAGLRTNSRTTASSSPCTSMINLPVEQRAPRAAGPG